MVRGKPAPDGAAYVSQNGYHYTKRNGKFKATHILLMEDHLGRPLEPMERVRFKNRDKTDLRIDNLEVTIKGKASLTQQRARLVARRDELNGQIADIDRQLQLLRDRARLKQLEAEAAP
jgi:hypothetical protein